MGHQRRRKFIKTLLWHYENALTSLFIMFFFSIFSRMCARRHADRNNFEHYKFGKLMNKAPCYNIICVRHLYHIQSCYQPLSPGILRILLTFLVPEEQGLLCWVWPLEGSVIIVIHTTGHVSCAPLHHRHILSYGELTLATCGIRRRSLRSRPWHE